MRALITGASGFIGVNLVQRLLEKGHGVVGYDRRSYAEKTRMSQALNVGENFVFVRGDLGDQELLTNTISKYNIEQVFHLAAETSVDRSINDPGPFVASNLVGTYNVLEAARKTGAAVHYVSTDEVFGELGETGKFTEETPLAPRSPYAATKAGGNFLVRAYATTYGLKTSITCCSNNYGPFQCREKLIPIVIDRVLDGKPIGIHGDGKYVRDWLYVVDHCDAMIACAERAEPGAFYCIGGDCELTVLQMVDFIATEVVRFTGKPRPPIEHVRDRLVNDRRYAVDHSRITQKLGWRPRTDSERALTDTVKWYIQNERLWR